MLYGSLFFENWTLFLSKIGVCFFENWSLFFWTSEFVFIENQRFFFLENRSLFLKMGVWFLGIGVCLLRKSEFVPVKNRSLFFENPSIGPRFCSVFCFWVGTKSVADLGEGPGVSAPPLLLKNRSMFSRCCINFAHELSCQIFTNHSIKIGRRAWPTRDHGEQNQNELSSLPVISGWIFASGFSLKSKCKLCYRNARRISYQFFKKN